MNLKKLLLFLFPIIVFLVAWFLLRIEPVSFLEAEELNVEAFTDRNIDGGKSDINQLENTDTHKSITFRLNEGFISPYAGFSLFNSRLWDLRGHDEVEMEIKLENTKNLELTITTYQNGVTKDHDPMSYRHNVMEIPISDQSSTYRLPLKKLNVAQWWLEKFKLRSTELGEADMSKVRSLSFVAKIRLDEFKDQSLKVSRITFRQDLSNFYIAGGLGMCFWYLCLFLYFRPVHRQPESATELVIHYKQTETGEQVTDTGAEILKYISENYQDPDLSLQKMSAQMRLSEKNISREIRSRYNLTFKEYLNGIRLAEAKRLLKESEKNISEIAYQVGFNSPNHFNRTFKNLEGCTPTEFKSGSTSLC